MEVTSQISMRSGLPMTNDLPGPVKPVTSTVCEMGVGVSACRQFSSPMPLTEAIYSILPTQRRRQVKSSTLGTAHIASTWPKREHDDKWRYRHVTQISRSISMSISEASTTISTTTMPNPQLSAVPAAAAKRKNAPREDEDDSDAESDVVSSCWRD